MIQAAIPYNPVLCNQCYNPPSQDTQNTLIWDGGDHTASLISKTPTESQVTGTSRLARDATVLVWMRNSRKYTLC